MREAIILLGIPILAVALLASLHTKSDKYVGTVIKVSSWDGAASLKMNKRTEDLTSSRAYEEAKLARRKFIIENNKKYHTGKKISEKDKELTSKRFKNIPKSEEHRKKISDSNKGKTKSDQHREKLSLSLIGKHKWSDERKKSHSEKISGENSKTAKKVEQLLDGITVNTFTSCDSAREYVLSTLDQKVSKVTFWRRVRGHSELFGFHWKFKDE